MRRVEFLVSLPKRPASHDNLSRVADCTDISFARPSLWLGSQTPETAAGGSAVIVGHIFFHTDYRPAAPNEPLARNSGMPERDARALIAEFWGAYLYIARDCETGSWVVMPDPSGLLPVYRLDLDSNTLLASDPDLFARCGAYSPCIAFQVLHDHLRRPELRARTTCLEQIDELVPGSLINLGPNQNGVQIWNPRDFRVEPQTRSFSESVEELRSICVGTVGAWTALFTENAVAASGGVDSSLICAAAAIAGSSFNCITASTADASGDERSYAHDVARACGVRCVDRSYDPALFNPTRPASLGLPRPGRRAFLTVLDYVLIDAMDELGASVVLDGNGGDNIFCFLHSSAPLVDQLRAEGMGSESLRTLLDLCRITGCSVPTMLRASLRRMTAGSSTEIWPADDSFLEPLIDSYAAQPLTQWLEEERRHTGRQDHLSLIMHAQNHIHGATTALSRFSPLASQPIVEFCLSVPTWFWTRGGRNRAVARAAFADILPHAIVARTSKAGPDSFIRAAFLANKAVISERLLDGVLADAGLFDRSALAHALGREPLEHCSSIGRLLDLLEAENWARSWIR